MICDKFFIFLYFYMFTVSQLSSPTENVLSTTSSPKFQCSELDFYNAAVPVSPHVNVPITANVQYRAAPPPLPPRRKERTDSCADVAQKRQAPDAPMLPPRDGDLSPPPIPPRINSHHFHSTGSNFHGQINDLINTNSLLLPNTSSIMIRRNSAIEKRTASTVVTSTSSTTSSLMISNLTMVAVPSHTMTVHSNIPNVPPHLSHLSTTTNILCDDQLISPALSSSTTTSPMTPMTPISPHLPSGYQTTDIYNHPQLFIKNISSSSVSAFSQHPSSHQHNQNQQIHHNIGTIGCHQGSSSKEFSLNADGLPKLPPKPSLSGNICSNSGIISPK